MAALLCFLLLAAPAGAAVVDLTLDGPGAEGMAFPDLEPGETGNTTIILHNAGSVAGSVAVWISNVTETDGGEDGARLDTYLLFSLSNDRLESTLDFPARITSFPQEPGGSPSIVMTRLDAGATTALIWHWEFRETGTPQNDAQGDTLSFIVHYTLTTLPQGDTGGGGGGGGGGGQRSIRTPPENKTWQQSPSPTVIPEINVTMQTTTARGGGTAPEDRLPLLELLLLVALIAGMIRLRYELPPVLKVAVAAGTVLLLVATFPLDYSAFCCLQLPGPVLAAVAFLIPVVTYHLSRREPTVRALWAGECVILCLSVTTGIGLLVLGVDQIGSLVVLIVLYLIALGAILRNEE